VNTCFDVANYFLKRQVVEEGDLMTNLKLQKLVYYAQGFYLAMTSNPLFNEPIEAWAHGPVCVPLYHEYKGYESGAIPVPVDVNAHILFDEKQHEVLDMVQTYFGQFSAWKLSNMTHEEPTWTNAFYRAKKEITHKEMRDYFKTQLIEDDEE
jgi:uncharacterized phage-associated protein